MKTAALSKKNNNTIQTIKTLNLRRTHTIQQEVTKNALSFTQSRGKRINETKFAENQIQLFSIGQT